MYKTKKLYWFFLWLADLIGGLLFFWKKFKRYPQNPKKILVIRLDHIGDMVLTTSFFKNLKKNYPKAEITVLCRSLTKPVAECIPSIDKIEVLNVPWFAREDSQGWWKVIKFAVRNHNKYDLAFELHSDPRNILLAAIISKYSVGYGIRGFAFLLNKTVKYDKKIKHIVERNLDLIRALNLKIYTKKLDLKIDKDLKAKVLRKLNNLNIKNKKIILIHPISGRKNKDWKLNKWNKLNEILLKKYKNSVIIYNGSKNDKTKLNTNIKFQKRKIFNCAGFFSLKEDIALMEMVDKIITVDTFPVHVASALNKSLVALYGPTLKEVWGPYLNKNAVVIEGVYKGCRGCELHKCKFLKSDGIGLCMKEIKLKDILEAL